MLLHPLKTTLGLSVFVCILTISTHIRAEYPEELIVSLKSKYSSLDPHKENLGSNVEIHAHFFDNLFKTIDDGSMSPNLLDSIEQPDDLTWIMKLKSGVKFHNGKEMTSEDIIFSFDRQKAIHPKSPYTKFLEKIKSIEIIDQYKFKITTVDILYEYQDIASLLSIIPKMSSTFTSEDSFTKDKFVIGTGPYIFEKETASELTLSANTNYHDKDNQSYFKKVKLKYYDSNEERIKSFINGETHVIDNLSVEEIKDLKSHDKFNLIQTDSDRLMFLYLDTYRSISPYILDYRGEKMKVNPLQDLRVRQALSKSINRQFIVRDLMAGAATPTGQLVKEGRLGYSGTLTVDQYDIETARKLLTDAGYEKGFQITLHGPSDRYPKGIELLESIADMWNKIGVKTTVVALPKAIYFNEATVDHKFSAGLIGYDAYGRIQAMLTDLLLPPEKDKKSSYGSVNSGRYNNPKVNDLVRTAMQSSTHAVRVRSFRDATELAMNDTGIIPLYFPTYTWGLQKGLMYWPEKSSNYIKIWKIKPSKK